MKSEKGLPCSTVSPFFRKILRKRTAISVLWSYPNITDCTARITAAAFFLKRSSTRNRSEQF